MDPVREWIEQAEPAEPEVSLILGYLKGDPKVPPIWDCYGDCRRSLSKYGPAAVAWAPDIWRDFAAWRYATSD